MNLRILWIEKFILAINYPAASSGVSKGNFFLRRPKGKGIIPIEIKISRIVNNTYCVYYIQNINLKIAHSYQTNAYFMPFRYSTYLIIFMYFSS